MPHFSHRRSSTFLLCQPFPWYKEVLENVLLAKRIHSLPICPTPTPHPTPQWGYCGRGNEKLGFPLPRVQGYGRYSIFMSGAGQNITLCASPPARNSVVLSSAFLHHSASCSIFPNLLSMFKCRLFRFSVWARGMKYKRFIQVSLLECKCAPRYAPPPPFFFFLQQDGLS